MQEIKFLIRKKVGANRYYMGEERFEGLKENYKLFTREEANSKIEILRDNSNCPREHFDCIEPKFLK